MATTGLRSMETSHKTISILRCKLILVGELYFDIVLPYGGM